MTESSREKPDAESQCLEAIMTDVRARSPGAATVTVLRSLICRFTEVSDWPVQKDRKFHTFLVLRRPAQKGAPQELLKCSLTWMGLVPAATIFMPSAMIAALRMVAVVVPSPAVSLVFEAACVHIQSFQALLLNLTYMIHGHWSHNQKEGTNAFLFIVCCARDGLWRLLTPSLSAGDFWPSGYQTLTY